MTAIEQRLKFILDKAEQRAALDGVQGIRDGIDEAARKSREAADDASALQKELANIGRNSTIAELVQEAAAFAKETGNSSKAVHGLDKSLKRFGASAKEIRTAATQFQKLTQETGKASETIGKTATTAEKLSAELAKLERKRSFDELARNAANLAVETGDAENATRDLLNQLDKVGATDSEIAGVVKQFDRMKVAAQDAAEASRGVNTDRFDRVSQDVSLAGDAESNLRAVGGAVGTLGGSAGAQIEGALNVGSELLAVTEAIPRLKEAAAGLPATLSSAASALGPGGLLVVGVAAGAAALAALYKASIAEQEAALKSFAAASKSFVDFASGGGTTADAEKEIQDIENRRAFIEAEIQRLEDKYASEGLNILDKVLNDGEEAIVGQISEFKDELDTLAAQESRYSEAIKNGELAKNDAASAAENLASGVESITDAFAASAQQSVSDAYNSNTSAANNVANSMQSAASSSESAASTISGAFSNLEKKASESANRIQSLEIGERGKSRGSFSLFTGKTRKSKGKDGASKDGGKSGKSDVDERNQARERIADAQRKFYDGQSKLITKFNQDQAKAQRKLQTDLANIRLEGQRKEADALRSRNFLALAEARENTAQSVNDRNQQSNTEQRERLINFDQQKADLKRQLDNVKSTEQQKLKVQAAGQKQALAMSGNFWAAFAQQQRQAMQSLAGGRRSQSTGNTGRQLRQLTQSRLNFGST